MSEVTPILNPAHENSLNTRYNSEAQRTLLFFLCLCLLCPKYQKVGAGEAGHLAAGKGKNGPNGPRSFVD